MDIEQFDTDPMKNTKNANRKYSQSSQSSVCATTTTVVTNANVDRKDGSIQSSSNRSNSVEGSSDTPDRNIWKNSGNSTIPPKTSISNISCNNDNSTIDSTLLSKCDSGDSTFNAPTSLTTDPSTDIKTEIKEEIDESRNSNPDVDIENLPPHAVSKFNVSYEIRPSRI